MTFSSSAMPSTTERLGGLSKPRREHPMGALYSAPNGQAWSARSSNATDRLYELHNSRKFIAGGRYLYATGRDLHQVNNCVLLNCPDTREGWATTSYQAEMALMTGAGIGVYYGDVRPGGRSSSALAALPPGRCRRCSRSTRLAATRCRAATVVPRSGRACRGSTLTSSTSSRSRTGPTKSRRSRRRTGRSRPMRHDQHQRLPGRCVLRVLQR
jgi:hypothetical protein